MNIEDSRIILNLIRLGALRSNNVGVVGEGHFWLHTVNGPLDVILEDLLDEG